jgi:hypothetical protein
VRTLLGQGEYRGHAGTQGFTVAYPGAHLYLRCCFKSWLSRQRCARVSPPCDRQCAVSHMAMNSFVRPRASASVVQLAGPGARVHQHVCGLDVAMRQAVAHGADGAQIGPERVVEWTFAARSLPRRAHPPMYSLPAIYPLQYIVFAFLFRCASVDGMIKRTRGGELMPSHAWCDQRR